MATPSNSEKLLSANPQKPLPPLPSLSQSSMNPSGEGEGNDFGKIFEVIQRRILLITSIAFAVASGMTLQAIRKPIVYQSGFQLLVEPVKSSDKLAGLTNSYGGRVTETSLDYQTQIQILKSPQLINKIIENDIYQKYPELSYGSIVGRLAIFQQGETKILNIRYQDSNPDRTKFVLDKLAVGYLRYSLEEQQTNLRQGLQFVDEQLPELINRVNTLQARLERFRQQYNFIDPQSQAQKLAAQADSLSAEKFEIQKQLVDVQTRYSILQNDGGIAALNSSANYQQLITQIRQIEALIALESTRYRSNSAPIQNLLNQRQNLMPLLNQEAQRVLGSQAAAITNELFLLQVRLNALSQAEAQINRQLEQMPTLDRQYTELQRDLTLATNSLNRFLEKRESLQIQGAETEVPWQVLSPPRRPGAPASNLINQIMTGVFAGLAAGVGVALLLERLDTVFYSVDVIKDKIKLPILGIIPKNKKLKAWQELTLEQQQNNQFNSDETAGGINEASIPFLLGHNFLPFLEAFRTLCTNIGFLSSDTPIKSFTISSPAPGDGKSTIAVHLAQAAAAMGNRVLLVDANLRLPQVHAQLNLANEFGLSNLINTDVDPDEVVQKVPLWENLFVLTAGQIPPDPTKLLSSNKMRSLMNSFCSKYDWVIYDTPPCTDVVDSKILAPHTDGLLMVVRLKKTDKNLLKEALESLKQSRHNILGLVVNSAKPQHNLSGYYGASTQTEAWTNTPLEAETEVHTQ